MSTVKTFSGIDDESKPSSRVLQPPGGGSNHIFGERPQEPAQNRPVAPQYQKKTSLFGSETSSNDNITAQANRRQSSGPTGSAAAPFASHDVPSNQAPLSKLGAPNPSPINPAPPEPARPSPARTGGNPLMGESSAPPQQAVHTSTKVRQPPGGASSGLW